MERPPDRHQQRHRDKQHGHRFLFAGWRGRRCDSLDNTPPLRLDEASSARWFDGWKWRIPASLVRDPAELPGGA